MQLPLTYGQCLRRILQSNKLSVNTLSRKMGYHSTTQLTRILNDEVSPALITRFHHQFMLIFDWLISPAQIRQLSVSLQYSCLGTEAFLTRRAMHRMLFEPLLPKSESLPLHVYPPQSFSCSSMHDLLENTRSFRQMELLVLGSSFDALLPVFAEPLSHSPAKDRLTIRHYFVMEEQPAQLVSQLSALMPFLNTHAYTGAYCTASSQEACRFLQTTQLAIGRCHTAQGDVVTTLFSPPQKDGICVYRVTGSDDLFTYYEHMVERYSEHMRPIKSVYAQPQTLTSLLTLCERDLFLEQARDSCFVRLDLCFQALPETVVLEAVDHGARLGLTPDDPLMLELRRVHRLRYDNLISKKEPTLLVFSAPALRRFAQTGHLSDHMFAMRDFTPAQRRAILAPLIEAVRANASLHLHILPDEAQQPIGAFYAYRDMGIQLCDNNTAYNLADNHSEVFVSMPDFADALSNYCAQTLIPESCMDQEASLAFLESLLEEITPDAALPGDA